MTDYCERCRRSMENHATARVNGDEDNVSEVKRRMQGKSDKPDWW